MITYINKDGNICEFTGTQAQQDAFTDTLEFIWGVWFEPKERLEYIREESTKEVSTSEDGEVTELDRYKKLLKDAKVKWSHLIQDVERARAKCEENNLL